MGRTSFSSKRTALPSSEKSITSCLPSVSATPISQSPSSRSTAMIPEGRGRENSDERGLLHDTFLGGEEHVAVVAELLHREDRVDALVLVHLQQVHDRLAAAGAAALRDLVDLDPVDLALVREAQHVVVRVGDEELLDEVVFLRGGGLLPRPPRFCARYSASGWALDVAGVRERDHHVLARDEVLQLQLLAVHHDLAAARVAELALHLGELVADDLSSRARAWRGCPAGPRCAAITSRYSERILSCSRPVRRCSCISRMRCACTSESR